MKVLPPEITDNILEIVVYLVSVGLAWLRGKLQGKKNAIKQILNNQNPNQ